MKQVRTTVTKCQVDMRHSNAQISIMDLPQI